MAAKKSLEAGLLLIISSIRLIICSELVNLCPDEGVDIVGVGAGVEVTVKPDVDVRSAVGGVSGEGVAVGVNVTPGVGVDVLVAVAVVRVWVSVGVGVGVEGARRIMTTIASKSASALSYCSCSM